jgi:hypothetical protein
MNTHTVFGGESEVCATTPKSEENYVQNKTEVEKKLPKKVTENNIMQQLPRKTTFNLFVTKLASGEEAQQVTMSDRLMVTISNIKMGDQMEIGETCQKQPQQKKCEEKRKIWERIVKGKWTYKIEKKLLLTTELARKIVDSLIKKIMQRELKGRNKEKGKRNKKEKRKIWKNNYEKMDWSDENLEREKELAKETRKKRAEKKKERFLKENFLMEWEENCDVGEKMKKCENLKEPITKKKLQPCKVGGVP